MAFDEVQQRCQPGLCGQRLLRMEAVGRLHELGILPGEALCADAGVQIHRDGDHRLNALYRKLRQHLIQQQRIILFQMNMSINHWRQTP
ncbi:hypothetical protein D3C80_1831050 [compost metagenome]